VEFEYVFTDKRRSVYTPAFRNNRLELFATFDFGDINSSIGQRYTSTVAPQALYFMNHPFIIEQSRAAAKRTLDSKLSDAESLSAAFELTLSRPPTQNEATVCLERLTKAGANEKSRIETWSMIYQSLLGSLDFRYLN